MLCKLNTYDSQLFLIEKLHVDLCKCCTVAIMYLASVAWQQRQGNQNTVEMCPTQHWFQIKSSPWIKKGVLELKNISILNVESFFYYYETLQIFINSYS